MTHAVTMMLTVTAASAYILPFAPAQHRIPARMPAIRAFAEEEAGVSTAPVTAVTAERPPIQPLTTVFELERAVADAKALDRLCVVKVYAPWCKTCVAIGPKYLRAAKANQEMIDFYEVDFAQCKPLCKHMGVESLPTGMIFKDGAKVEHTSLRPSGFKSFVKTLMAFAEPESPGSAALESYQTNMDELRETEQLVTRVAGLSEDPSYEARWFQSNMDELLSTYTMDALSDVTR
eukprot:scaffold81858_cov57-Phaeocystis_antarctica.AAC.2